MTSFSGVSQRSWSPTALQRSNRGKCAHLLRDLDATADLPPHCPHFALQLLYLTHRWWSETEGPDIGEGAVYALAAAACICTKLHSARYADPAPFQLPDPGSQPAPFLTFSHLLLLFGAGALTTCRLCIRLRLCMKL